MKRVLDLLASDDYSVFASGIDAARYLLGLWQDWEGDFPYEIQVQPEEPGRVVQTLVQLLDADSTRAGAAAWVLGRLGVPSLITPLTQSLHRTPLGASNAALNMTVALSSLGGVLIARSWERPLNLEEKALLIEAVTGLEFASLQAWEDEGVRTAAQWRARDLGRGARRLGRRARKGQRQITRTVILSARDDGEAHP